MGPTSDMWGSEVIDDGVKILSIISFLLLLPNRKQGYPLNQIDNWTLPSRSVPSHHVLKPNTRSAVRGKTEKKIGLCLFTENGINTRYKQIRLPVDQTIPTSMTDNFGQTEDSFMSEPLSGIFHTFSICGTNRQTHTHRWPPLHNCDSARFHPGGTDDGNLGFNAALSFDEITIWRVLEILQRNELTPSPATSLPWELAPTYIFPTK